MKKSEVVKLICGMIIAFIFSPICMWFGMDAISPADEERIFMEYGPMGVLPYMAGYIGVILICFLSSVLVLKKIKPIMKKIGKISYSS